MVWKYLHKRTLQGFTLIELLIAVAIISILALIAVPNFLEAQTRSKVSRVQSDFRVIALALEAYHADNNAYPNWMAFGFGINPTSLRLRPLTTPIGYMTIMPPRDPFQDKYQPEIYDTYDYVEAESFARNGEVMPSYRCRGAEWRLCSPGPDMFNTFGGPASMNPLDNPGHDYDPTNGSISNGDIVRVGPMSKYPGNHLYPDKVE